MTSSLEKREADDNLSAGERKPYLRPTVTVLRGDKSEGKEGYTPIEEGTTLGPS